MANLQQHLEESVSALAFESAPWLATDRTVEEPRRAPEQPLHLAGEEHLVEIQESDSILRGR